jgi:Domain of unknown function (DUF4112)
MARMTRTYEYDFKTETLRPETREDARSRRARVERIERLATLLDTAFILPGTNVRFGADALIGLLPGLGDTITTALSAYIVYEAYQLGVPNHVLARMIANVAFDSVTGVVPVAGDVLDVFWRANRRNIRLLREHLERQGEM